MYSPVARCTPADRQPTAPSAGPGTRQVTQVTDRSQRSHRGFAEDTRHAHYKETRPSQPIMMIMTALGRYSYLAKRYASP